VDTVAMPVEMPSTKEILTSCTKCSKSQISVSVIRREQ
jgi:hypothetical protein